MKFQEIILKVMKEEQYKPLGYKEMLYLFDVTNKKEKKQFKKTLDELLNQGKIVKNKKGKYKLAPEGLYVSGTLQGHAKGFGFVIPDDGLGGNDIFVPASNLNGALDKDKVIVKIVKKTDRRDEGEIYRIVERGHKKIVGTFKKSRNFGFVIPDNDKLCKDIYVPIEKSMKAKEGDKVVVDITEWPKKDKNPEGRVIEVLGQPGDPGIEVLSIIREYDFNVAFPQEVQEQVEKIPQTIDRSQHPKRRDLTQKTIVTIDGADAKDLDDGISIEKLDNGNYRLGVHIADVSHYVKENSPLDQEAYDRATSVYLVDRVIPMLPKELSNGICSLNAGVDRLAFTCEMEINTAGKVVNHEFFKSVINVDKRMTYEVVADVLEGTPVEDKEYLDYKEMLLDMERLAELLHDERRHQRGSIDFDFPEAKIILDENGRTKDVVLYERTMAHRIIEEFMLVCNETIAEHMYWTNLPFLFRNHESPSEEKIKALREFLSNFGYKLRKGKDIKPKDVQKLVEDIADTDEEGFLSRLILRSMQQAKYEPNNEGHFGLAAEYYTHFTSPIRRYPDLYIHRVMGEMLDKKLNDKLIEKREDKIDEVAEHVSEKERAAEKAERDTDDLKKSEYMEDKVGKEFRGVISGVTSFGFFVELDNTVEGLVRMQDLTDDYYIYEEKNHRLIGERTKKMYKLGDKIDVVVANVNVALRQVDLKPA